MNKSVEIQIGASGWSYPEWKKVFYPAGCKTTGWLEYYSARFSTVEVNNSFYRLPLPEILKRWKEITPGDFVFSVKASRFITHVKRLADAQEPICEFLDRMDILGPKLGPVIFQLPPNWNLRLDRLEEFLKSLPKKYRYAIELRDPDWQKAEVYKYLEKYGVAFCIYDLKGYQSPFITTSDLVYVRLHGPLKQPYKGSYSGTLSKWANRIEKWNKEGKDVYVYFDNTMDGAAIKDALDLKEMLGLSEVEAHAA